MHFHWHWYYGNEQNRQNLYPHETYILVGRQKMNKKKKEKIFLKIAKNEWARGLEMWRGVMQMYEADREGGEGVSEKVTLRLKIWSNWGHGPNRYLGVSVSRQRGEQLCGPSGRWWLACWENAMEATVPCMRAVGNEARERKWVEHRLRSCGQSEDTGCPAEGAGKWLSGSE